jgi:hypothetical protein
MLLVVKYVLVWFSSHVCLHENVSPPVQPMNIKLLLANQIVQIHFSEALYRNLTDMYGGLNRVVGQQLFSNFKTFLRGKKVKIHNATHCTNTRKLSLECAFCYSRLANYIVKCMQLLYKSKLGGILHNPSCKEVET